MSVKDQELKAVAADIAHALASSFEDESGVFVATPLLYPGGSHVVVRLAGAGNRFFISDHGYGAMEADLMGGEATFIRIANQVAAKSGVQFDQHCFFLSDVTRDQLVTAVLVIANASKEAADQTAFHLANRQYREREVELVERLVSIFGLAAVQREVELIGASTHRWRFDAAVTLSDHSAVFDLVKPHQASVVYAVAKFRDIADLDDSPRRIGVLSDKDKTDPADINLLSKSARVISLSVSDNVYRKAA